MTKRSPRVGDSFGPVADAYDRARPSYPEEAVRWLTGSDSSMILELGAGTGKLTEVLNKTGNQLLATDPLPEMLATLARRSRSSTSWRPRSTSRCARARSTWW